MYKNIIANLTSKVWSLISIFLFIPLYIHFLGIELYGIVSFFATMQSVLLLLDVGLSVTLRREFSFGKNSPENQIRKYKLLRSIEFCYLLIFIATVLVTFFGAEFIVHQWLNIGNIDPKIAITAIRLMGISIALQFFSTLYSGGLLGLQKQVITNVYQVGWSVMKNGFVLLVLWLIAPDIRLFYFWFIISDLLYLFLLKHQVHRSLEVNKTYSWSVRELDNLKPIWKYALGMFSISIISAFNFQLDKLVISKMLPISELGVYNLAFSLSQVSTILVNAISIAIFPKFVYYFSVNESERLKDIFRLAYKILGVFALAVSAFMFFYTRELLEVWTRNPEIAAAAWLPAAILIAGSLFNTLQVTPFNLALAHGVTKINTVYGLINIIILIPLLFFLIKHFGLVGAALSWFSILFLFTPVYNCIVYKRFVNSKVLKWYLKDTVVPMLFIFALAALFFELKRLLGLNSGLTLVYALVTGSLTLVVSLFIFIKDFPARIKLITNSFKF